MPKAVAAFYLPDGESDSPIPVNETPVPGMKFDFLKHWTDAQIANALYATADDLDARAMGDRSAFAPLLRESAGRIYTLSIVSEKA